MEYMTSEVSVEYMTSEVSVEYMSAVLTQTGNDDAPKSVSNTSLVMKYCLCKWGALCCGAYWCGLEHISPGQNPEF